MDNNFALIVVAMIYGITNLIGTIYAARRSAQAKHIAAEVNESVGPINGETVHSILNELREMNLYQHKRNHDMINIEVSNAMRLHLIGKELNIDIPPPNDVINDG